MEPSVAKAAKVSSSDQSGSSLATNVAETRIAKSPSTIVIDASTVDFKSAWQWGCEATVSTSNYNLISHDSAILPFGLPLTQPPSQYLKTYFETNHFLFFIPLQLLALLPFSLTDGLPEVFLRHLLLWL